MMNAWLTADSSLFLRSVAFNLSFRITVLIDYVFWGTEAYRFQKKIFFWEWKDEWDGCVACS